MASHRSIEENGTANGTYLRRTQQLQEAGVAWLQYHRYAEPDRPYRRLPLPWATLVFTLGATGRWRSPNETWRDFPVTAVRGHAGTWSLGEDAAGSVEYAAALLDPWVLEQLFGVPARAFKDQVVDLRDLVGTEAALVAERLEMAATPEGKLDVLQAFLAARIRNPRSESRTTAFMSQCRRLAGGCRIANQGQADGLRDRRFRQVFRDATGFSPKGWARLERFAALIRHIHPISWGTRDDFGAPEYCDQAHAITEFRQFSGMTPRSYCEGKSNGDARVFMVSEPQL